MSKHVYLSLAIHNHQPVGNFDHVFAEAYRVAYEPMIAALERHPAIKMALHYTGPLRDWLVEHHPELMGRIRALAARGQVEMMTGGYYEPVLVALPDADKLGQVRKLTRAVWDDFGYSATGAWLAERVWEPHLAKPMAEAGVEYTIVDDTHFKYVGLKDENLFGYYVTEEQGTTLKIFGTSKHLRYVIPWAEVDEVIGWLHEQAEDLEVGLGPCPKVAVMGDDGEKFGLWPGTYEHCWGPNAWMERFFSALEANGEWLETIAPGEYARRFASIGRVYLPTASYDEMTEWALPANLSSEIVHLKHQLEAEDRQDILRFVKGGFWRSFMVKYPEINTMHKKMLLVSEKVHRMTNDQTPNPNELHGEGVGHSALDHLWAGQCNCPYWHGVFGGIYLFHIRAANFEHLLKAESIADRAIHGDGPWVTWRAFDFDRDASDEILVESDAQNLYFDPADGGSCFEWDWRARAYNLLNTLTRRPEGYHADLRQAGERGEIVVAGQEGAPENIHTTVVRAKEPDLHLKLHYDWYRRSSFLDHFLHPDVTPDDFYRCQYGETGDFVNRPYECEVKADQGESRLALRLWRDGHVWDGPHFVPIRVEKRIETRGDSTALRVRYTLTNTGGEAIHTRFGVETNWGLLGGNGPTAHYEIPGQPDYLPLDSKGETEEVGRVRLVLGWLDMGIELSWARPATLWRFPIETISNSEAGFERIYQGSCVMPIWEIHLTPGESWQVEVDFALGQK
ncbi:MAG: alpha-amylase/4-alpha-glucanotransferase domain-containing protein [Chloroflexota bacterium]|nr:alpha-amylase/4-alpha-glucanotransferase domain-containing protein [Chloroflexota bacterium]